MKSQVDSLNPKRLPHSPGVYFFLNKNKDILYIGKATDLRDRVKSYFSKDIFETRGPKIVKMLNLSKDIDFIQTDSVLEALLLENFLIKKHNPPYNTKEKDDKSYKFVVITKEDFPRVLLVRGRDILDSSMKKQKLDFQIDESFGPFFGQQIKDGLGMIRKIFPYRDTCPLPIKGRVNKPCFNRQIGLCPGVCSGEISKKDYKKNIENIKKFLRGEKSGLLKNLEKEMNDLAKRQEFEKAGTVKKQIFSLKHIKDISLLSDDFKMNKGIKESLRIESYDISHISGSFVVGAMVVMEDFEFKKDQYRKFKIKNNPDGNDLKSLKEIFERRLLHSEWRMPDAVLVDGGENQRKVFEKIISEKGLDIKIVSLVKDDKHKARELSGPKELLVYTKELIRLNEETHRFTLSFHRKLREKIFE